MTPDPTPAPDPSPWMTVPESAARARCGPKVIYRAIRQGKLKATRLTATRELRVHVEWLDAWLGAATQIVNPHAPGAPVPFPQR